MNAISKVETETDLQRNWIRLRPLILKSVAFTNAYNEVDLLKGVMNGAWTFWPGDRSFIFASVDKYPTLTKLNIFLAGGDHNEVFQIEPAVVAWAKSLGATQSFTEARMGLDRLNEHGHRNYYTDAGYKRSRVVYVKDI